MQFASCVPSQSQYDYNANLFFASKTASLTSKAGWNKVCEGRLRKQPGAMARKKGVSMKANLLRKRVLTGAAMGLVSGLALSCIAGPGIIIVPPAPPMVVISPPAPPVPVVVAAPGPAVVVPDNY